MEYKGYEAIINYDDEAKIFHGEVIKTKDVITFQGTSVEELNLEFIESVEDYLEWCKKLKRSPDKPFSGTLSLRIDSELHSKLYVCAEKKKMSINAFIKEKLNEVCI